MSLVSGDNRLKLVTSIDNSGLSKGVINAQGIIRGFAANVDKMDVYAGLSVGAALAFSKIATDAFDMSKEYEQTMLEVQTISQATTDDFSGMSEAILNVGLEVPQTANELAKAYYQIASAGYDGAAGLKLLDVSAKAAIGGVTDVETAADGVTSIMNAWKISAEGAEGITDKLFKTVKLGKTTFPELSNNISQVASIASSASIPLEEILAAVASLTKTGVPTAQAFTQIKSAILSSNKVLGDGWAKTMTFQEGMQAISDKSGGLQSEIQKNVGRVEALNAVLGLTGENAKVAADDLRGVSDSAGSAGEAFKKMVSSAENQAKLLAANIEAAFKPLGDFILKNFKSVTEFLNKAFKSGDIEKFAKGVGVAVSALAAYKTVSTLSSISMMDFKRALVVARKAMSSLNLVTKMNPWGLVAAGVAAVVTAFIAFREQSKKVTKELTDIDKATKAHAEAVSGERGELDSLFFQLKKTNKGTADRQRLLDTVNSKYNLTLTNLSDEAAFLKQIDDAYESLIANMKRKIALDAQTEVITKLLHVETTQTNLLGIAKKQLADLEADALNGQVQMYEQRKKLLLNQIAAGEENVKAIKQQQKDIIESTNETVDALDKIIIKDIPTPDAPTTTTGTPKKRGSEDLVKEIEYWKTIRKDTKKTKDNINAINIAIGESDTSTKYLQVTWEEVADLIWSASNALDAVGQAVGGVNEKLGKTISEIADVAKDAVNIGVAIVEQNWVAVAVQGVQLISKLFTIRQRKAEEAAKADEEALQRQIELYQQFTTTTSQSITDSILEGFKNGKFAAEDFASDFESLMKNAMLETFKVQFLQKQFDEFYKAFGEAAESDGALSEAEIAALKEQFNANIINAQAGFDTFNDMFEGVFGSGVDTPASSQGMAGEIRASLTEETGTVLAGTMNSIRLFVSEQNEILENMHTSLIQIVDNTAYNKQLDRLENIESLLTEQAQSLRSTGA